MQCKISVSSVGCFMIQRKKFSFFFNFFFFGKKEEYPVCEKLVFGIKFHTHMNFAKEKARAIYFKSLKTI